ncbi:hypothetical protein D3C72_1536620 [compost metagenome]
MALFSRSRKCATRSSASGVSVTTIEDAPSTASATKPERVRNGTMLARRTARALCSLADKVVLEVLSKPSPSSLPDRPNLTLTALASDSARTSNTRVSVR